MVPAQLTVTSPLGKLFLMTMKLNSNQSQTNRMSNERPAEAECLSQCKKETSAGDDSGLQCQERVGFVLKLISHSPTADPVG